jgi:uncharacterized protein
VRAAQPFGWLLALTVASAAWPAAQIPSAPDRWVTDTAAFLSAGTRQQLDDRLAAYEQQTGHQVLVWIGRTTSGDSVEDWSARAFQAWKVGRRGLDDGLVLFIFSDDHRLRIEVGYGLEERIPDAVASRVIRDVLVPGIRAGDRDAAVSAGVDALLAAAQAGTWNPKPSVGWAQLPTAAKARLVLFGVAVAAFLIFLLLNPRAALRLLFLWSLMGRRRGGGPRGPTFSGGGGRSGGGGASGGW